MSDEPKTTPLTIRVTKEERQAITTAATLLRAREADVRLTGVPVVTGASMKTICFEWLAMEAARIKAANKPA